MAGRLTVSRNSCKRICLCLDRGHLLTLNSVGLVKCPELLAGVEFFRDIIQQLNNVTELIPVIQNVDM